MSFQLAQAYVELTAKGFKTVSGELDRVKQRFEGATGKAGALSQAVRGAGQEMLKTVGASQSLGEKMDYLRDITGSAADALEQLKELQLKTVAADTDAVSESLSKSEGWAGKLKDKLVSTGGKVADLVTKHARLLGIIGLVLGVAYKVGTAIYQWSLEEFNKQAERSLELTRELAKANEKHVENQIADAKRLPKYEDQMAALMALHEQAQATANNIKNEFNKADQAAGNGWGNWFKRFADGKLDEELTDKLKDTKERSDSAQRSLENVVSAIENLRRQQSDGRSALAVRLEEERILAEQGAQALRAYQLEKQGLSRGEAVGVAKQEFDLAAQQQERSIRESISESVKDQLDSMSLLRIEVEHGAEAAARERDRRSGLNQMQQEALAMARQALREAESAAQRKSELAQQEIKDREAIADKQREEMEAKQQVQKSYEQEVQQLRLKHLLIVAGSEAHAREQERLQGFTKEQSDQLAMMRRQVELAEEKKKAEEANAKNGEKSLSTMGKVVEKAKQLKGLAFVGLADLADQSQTQKQESKSKINVGNPNQQQARQFAINERIQRIRLGMAGGDQPQMAKFQAQAGAAAVATREQMVALDIQRQQLVAQNALLTAATGQGIKIAGQPRGVNVPAASIRFGRGEAPG